MSAQNQHYLEKIRLLEEEVALLKGKLGYSNIVAGEDVQEVLSVNQGDCIDIPNHQRDELLRED